MASSDRIRLGREEQQVRCTPARPYVLLLPAGQPASQLLGAGAPCPGPPRETQQQGLPRMALVGREGHRVGSYWASRALSLSSFPHSQSFPGSTAKCRGSNLCSESVRGITAGTQKRETCATWPRVEAEARSPGVP